MDVSAHNGTAKMEKQRFYVDTELNDDEAYREAMQFACELANQDSEIKRVVLLAATKRNVDWLTRAFDDQVVKALFSGTTFKDCKPTFIIKTKKTYNDPMTSHDIVITMALDSEDVMLIDNFWGVKVIIAIPWLKEKLQQWLQTWSPIDIRSNSKPEESKLPDPIAQIAFTELTNKINMSTGITHPSDNRDAKTYVRALHKYVGLNGDEVASYLCRELGWNTRHADDLKKLIDTLNNGKYFKGGQTTGLKSYINYWKQKL